MKTCPYCAEKIQNLAKKCRFCGEWLNEIEEVKKEKKTQNTQGKESGKQLKVTKNNLNNNNFKNRRINFLYLDRNRISGGEYFIGGLKVLAIFILLLLPISFLFIRGDSLGKYSSFGDFLNISFYSLLILLIIFSLRIRIQQIIARWHDLGLSGWYSFFNIINLISFILIFLPGEKGENKYGIREGQSNIKKIARIPESKRKKKRIWGRILSLSLPIIGLLRLFFSMIFRMIGTTNKDYNNSSYGSYNNSLYGTYDNTSYQPSSIATTKSFINRMLGFFSLLAFPGTVVGIIMLIKNKE